VMAGLVLVAFAAFAWNEAGRIRGAAAFFPSIVIGALGVFSLIYLVRSVLAGRPGEAMFERWWIFAAALVISLVYVNLVVRIGYVTSTAVFIPVLAWVIGFRRPVYIAVTTVVYLASVYLLFEIVFRRPLPTELLLEYLRSLRG
jgi:putative tricarboxylic transport membrane protein